MRNVLKHQSNLRKLILDERLTPNRRLLAEMLLMVMDHKETEFGQRILKLTEDTFGTPQRIQYVDPEDVNKDTDRTTIDKEVKDNLKSVFSKIMEND